MFKHIVLLVTFILAGCIGVQYTLSVAEQKAIPQVSVKVGYKDNGIYQVDVRNESTEEISLQWNSSAYLNTSGGTVRLIHIEDVDAFPEKTPVEQEHSTITPGSRFRSYFVGESWIDFSRRGVAPKPRDSEKKAMVYLAFSVEGKRVYWKGEVSFQSANP